MSVTVEEFRGALSQKHSEIGSDSDMRDGDVNVHLHFSESVSEWRRYRYRA